MTIGMILDFLITCQNEDTPPQDAQPRMATQADIDAF
jgi:hypothetical protein